MFEEALKKYQAVMDRAREILANNKLDKNEKIQQLSGLSSEIEVVKTTLSMLVNQAEPVEEDLETLEKQLDEKLEELKMWIK